MGRRAEDLANRIEQGANALTSFAESLTEDEWRKQVLPDGRTVGVIVHHVGFVYPIEVDLARTVADGKPVAVTWADVAQLNAKHAKDHAGIGRKEATEFVRKNGKAAAEAVRQFTDEDLERANSVAMNSNAPLTAQFVIEDHALRHSWHHVAKIRAALGR